MRSINWYNPEESVFPAIAEAQARGDVVPPHMVPSWLLGVVPGTPALPSEAGQVSFRGGWRPTEAETIVATFGYGDAGAANPCGREAGAAGDAYDKIRLAYIAAAGDWGWDISEINALDWNLAETANNSNRLLTGMLAEYCGVPTAVATERFMATRFEPAAFRAAILSLVGEFCPQSLPETVTTTTVVENGVEKIIIEDKEPEKKKGGYPVWGYALAGTGLLVVIGGVAYYTTRKR